MVGRVVRFSKKRRLLPRFSLTTWLIFINVILFFVFSMALMYNLEFVNFIAIQPSSILAGSALWTFLTSMFMHANAFHLFVNMFTLFFLGSFSEKIIGRKRFLWLFLAAGIFGSIAFVAFAYLGTFFSFGESVFGGMSDSAVGASGALFGLLQKGPFYGMFPTPREPVSRNRFVYHCGFAGFPRCRPACWCIQPSTSSWPNPTSLTCRWSEPKSF